MIALNFVQNGLVLISNLVDPHVWLVYVALLITDIRESRIFCNFRFSIDLS